MIEKISYGKEIKKLLEEAVGAKLDDPITSMEKYGFDISKSGNSVVLEKDFPEAGRKFWHKVCRVKTDFICNTSSCDAFSSYSDVSFKVRIDDSAESLAALKKEVEILNKISSFSTKFERIGKSIGLNKPKIPKDPNDHMDEIQQLVEKIIGRRINYVEKSGEHIILRDYYLDSYKSCNKMCGIIDRVFFDDDPRTVGIFYSKSSGVGGDPSQVSLNLEIKNSKEAVDLLNEKLAVLTGKTPKHAKITGSENYR